MIGFDITGKKKESVTKWEDSLFGGYYRTVMDYPDVKIHNNVDFDFGALPGTYGSYYLKEKIMKIFLSKVKTHGLTDYLLNNCTVEKKMDAWGDETIESTVSNESKLKTIRELVKEEGEYGPMFSHYMKFIMDTRIYFYKATKVSNKYSFMPPPPKEEEQQEEEQEEKEEGSKQNSKSSGKSSEEKNEKKSGNSGEKDSKEKEDSKEENSGEGEKNVEEKDEPKDEKGGEGGESADSEKEEKPQEDKELEKKLEDELEKRKQEIEERERKIKEQKNKSLGKPTKAEIQQMIEAFRKALRDVVEESVVHSYISGFNQPTKIIFEREDSHDTTFHEEDKRIAETLVKMLDISFDPTREIVKNLRLGKLDVAKIAEVPAGNISIYKQDLDNQATKPFSVVILCDESGSMGSGHSWGGSGDKLYTQYRIVKQLYLAFSDILPQNKIYVYGHTGIEQPELFVYQDAYRPSFVRTIDHMLESHDHCSNYDGPIIEEVYNQVRNSTDDRIIFIVLSDGQPAGHRYGGEADKLKMRQIIEKCKRDEFVTVGVGIQYMTSKDLYQYTTTVTDLNEMAKKVSHIVNHVVKTEFQ